MIGWESVDATFRMIMYQTLQGGNIKSKMMKAPKYATIPTEFHFEIPTSGIPFKFYSAGTSRA